MVLTLIAIFAITPSCTNDQGRDASGGATTSSNSADALSTTTGVAGTASPDPTGGADLPADGQTPAGVADIWTAPGEASPLMLGTGAAEPEYPAGKDGTVAELADGKVDLLVVQVDEESHQILVNVVVLVTGSGAKAEATADGVLRPGEELTGNYYVRDLNPKLRGVGLANNVELRGEKGTAVETSTGIADVSAALIGRLSTAPGIPYRATVSGGRVSRLVVPAVDDPTLAK